MKLTRKMKAKGCHIPMPFRFWLKVNKTSTCWLWKAKKNIGGYGQFQFRGRNVVAHRVAFILTVGEIPKGMCVLHRCDVRSCVNPDHLFLGTKADNNHDRDRKGRQAIGESNGKSILTAETVRKIKELSRFEGLGQVRISRLLKLSTGAVHGVLYGGTWRHLNQNS